MNDNQAINMKVDYEIQRVRDFVVQCPECNEWFRGRDISSGDNYILDVVDMAFAEYLCPLCGCEFGGYKAQKNIEAATPPEIYKGVCHYAGWVKGSTNDD